jgi:ring-1,2-phenylacetyl-CoA epoxidase subunit PaaB
MKNKEVDHQGDLWEVFLQSKSGLAFKHVGSLHAYDKCLAIKNARDLFTRRNEGNAIWVVPSKEIVAVSINDTEAYFEPNTDKIYRHPTFYNIPEEVKQI